MDNKVTVCTLVTWGFWLTGTLAFALIAVGILGIHHFGLGFIPVVAGSLIYVKRLLRYTRDQALAAFTMGHMSGSAENSQMHLVQ